MRYCRQVFVFAIGLPLLLLLLSSQVSALPLDLGLSTTEYINGLVFYPDGTYSLNNATGSLFITNPSLNHTVADININFSSGITPSSIHINELGYNNTTIVSYQVASTAISLPISVVETTTPATLKQGENQTLIFDVTISNSGTDIISVFQFDKIFPPELTFTGITSTNGSLNFNNNSVTWTNLTILPASGENMQISFYTTPSAAISLPTSNLSFALPTYSASTALSLSAVTTTTNFTLEKEKLSNDIWRVGVRVWDESEFNYSLYKTEVYVSDPLLTNTTLIKTFNPNITLQPGQSWYNELNYSYSGVPVFFTRIYYTLSFNLSGSSIPVTPVDSGGFIINSIVTPIKETPGGGGSSGEDIYNIICFKTGHENAFKETSVSYGFELDCNIIKYVNFTSLVNAGEIVLKVETLKNTSSLVSIHPPNIVYKNINISVGNYGWATPNNISDVTIVFIVDKSWIIKNDIEASTIVLYRYVDGAWYKLDTKKVGEDSKYLYFEAETPGFFPFAISGEKVGNEFMLSPTNTTTGTGVLPTFNGSTLLIDETKRCWWCPLIPLIIYLIIYYYLRKTA